MDFNSDNAKDAINRLKAAFKKAAAADTGSAKPLFQKLSDQFNKTMTKGFDTAAELGPDVSPDELKERMAGAIQGLQVSFMQTVMAAQSNPKAMAALQELQKDVVGAVKAINDLQKPKKPGGPKPPSGGRNLDL